MACPSNGIDAPPVPPLASTPSPPVTSSVGASTNSLLVFHNTAAVTTPTLAAAASSPILTLKTPSSTPLLKVLLFICNMTGTVLKVKETYRLLVLGRSCRSCINWHLMRNIWYQTHPISNTIFWATCSTTTLASLCVLECIYNCIICIQHEAVYTIERNWKIMRYTIKFMLVILRG